MIPKVESKNIIWNQPIPYVKYHLYDYYQDTSPIIITDTTSPGQLIETGFEYEVYAPFDAKIFLFGKTRGYAYNNNGTYYYAAEIYDETNSTVLDQSYTHLVRPGNEYVSALAIGCSAEQSANTVVNYQFNIFASNASEVRVYNTYFCIDYARVNL